MKLLVFLAALVAFCAGNTIPTIPGDNSHYVEGKSRYIWMPDGEGVSHLVDLHEPAEPIYEDIGARNQYWLFTRRNLNNHQMLVHGNAGSVFNSNYAPNRPTIVIVHGWNSNGNSAINPLITLASLNVQDCNIIVVDWNLASQMTYNTAVNAVPSVGQFLGNFMEWLIGMTGGNWNNVHFIGFGLGAHVVGNAGRQAEGKPARITGLDPAGPTWSSNSNALDRNAGIYVECIHTNGGVLGIGMSIGDADFYPNGGRHQPGCITSICSHMRAYEYMASSIQHNNYVGRLCGNEAINEQCTPDTTLNMGNGIITKRGCGVFCLSARNPL